MRPGLTPHGTCVSAAIRSRQHPEVRLSAVLSRWHAVPMKTRLHAALLSHGPNDGAMNFPRLPLDSHIHTTRSKDLRTMLRTAPARKATCALCRVQPNSPSFRSGGGIVSSSSIWHARDGGGEVRALHTRRGQSTVAATATYALAAPLQLYRLNWLIFLQLVNLEQSQAPPSTKNLKNTYSRYKICRLHRWTSPS